MMSQLFNKENELQFLLNFEYDQTEPRKVIGVFDDFEQCKEGLKKALTQNALDNARNDITQLSDLLVEKTLPSIFTIDAAKKNEFSFDERHQLTVYAVALGEESLDDLDFKGERVIAEHYENLQNRSEKLKDGVERILESDRPNQSQLLRANKSAQQKVEQDIKFVEELITPIALERLQKEPPNSSDYRKEGFLEHFERYVKEQSMSQYKAIKETIDANNGQTKNQNRIKPR